MTHRIEFLNDVSEISRLHSFFETIGREENIPEEVLDEMNLAVEEAVVNVISYAYPEGKEGHVLIESVASEEGRLVTFVISDHGRPFDPTQVEDADISLGVDEREIGGLGIFMVRNIMDEVNYERTADGRNVLTLRKQF